MSTTLELGGTTCPSCGGHGLLSAGCRGLAKLSGEQQQKLIGEICPTCEGEGSSPQTRGDAEQIKEAA